MMDFAAACERNKFPILGVLVEEFRHVAEVLEIGSGTGQHAVYFGRRLPHLRWQTSDLPASHASIRAWIHAEGVDNVLAPLVLDVNAFPWPVAAVDAVFTANTAHIMHWDSVVNLFRGVGEVLRERGVFCLYGPLNYDGRFTSDSNALFDQSLKRRDPASGIRDFAALDALARDCGLILGTDHAMPANNRLVVWRRTSAKHSPPDP
jgi:SAM-dependent methyltransferase